MALSVPPGDRSDLICFSHLRWHVMFQRPHQLMRRFARERRVFFVEEPAFDASAPGIEVVWNQGVQVVVPHLPPECTADDAAVMQRHLLRTLCDDRQIASAILWLNTPRAWPLAAEFDAAAIVYDCVDDSGPASAPPDLRDREAELLAHADVVFTGSYSLFEAKRDRHCQVHPFPSPVDVERFGRARVIQRDPIDQHPLGRPRIGFRGAIDERMNLDLLRDLAAARPDWQFVLIGPVAGVPEAALPRAANLHYLGAKRHDALPSYLAGWDVAMLPFAHNAATRYPSPTQPPEYLAAGCPVVSTSIRDVLTPYGERGLVHVADTAPEFVAAIDRALAGGRQAGAAADTFLATMSWDQTWSAMRALVEQAESERRGSVLVPQLLNHGF